MLRLAIIAMGGHDWIAGVQYIHSLLLGNSLLPPDERALVHVYYDPACHKLSDYSEVKSLAAGLHAADLHSASQNPVYNTARGIVRSIVRQHSWPSLPAPATRRLLSRHRIDVVFAGVQLYENITVPQICWIPDFQHVYRKDFFSTEECKRRDELLANMMERAQRVVVSNQCSYDDAARLYPEKREKLALLPFTMSLGTRWRDSDTAQVIGKYALPEKFLLFPSQFWKHKNHLTVFRAIHQVHQRGLTNVVLVCTGFPLDPRFPEYATELQQFINHNGLTDAIRVLGLLPRQDQVQLMRAAAAIVQASFFEGWSAIVEEARSMGKQVFASDIPMHREQRAANVYLFDPNSVESIAGLIASHWPRLLKGPQLDAETVAEKEYQVRIVKFAREFMRLANSLVVTPAAG